MPERLYLSVALRALLGHPAERSLDGVTRERSSSFESRQDHNRTDVGAEMDQIQAVQSHARGTRMVISSSTLVQLGCQQSVGPLKRGGSLTGQKSHQSLWKVRIVKQTDGPSTIVATAPE